MVQRVTSHGDSDSAELSRPFHASQLKSLAERIEQEIERRIVTGEFASGARLSEVALADLFGVSRGPVREALQGLRRAGLVEIIANKGAVVRRPNAEEAAGLYELRGALFSVMAERVAETATPDVVAALAENVRASEAAIKADDFEAYYRLNLDFHEAIVAMSGLVRAAGVYRDVVKEMHLFRRRSLLAGAHSPKRSLAEHKLILRAVRANDGEAAFAAARAHIKAGKSRFLAALASDGGDAGAPTAARPQRESRGRTRSTQP